MRQYIVDAFTDKVFGGNPAAVCVLDKWLSEELMQNIAMENNLSETAFALKMDNEYYLRWFTPGGEVDLCGHATLATGYVILNYYEKNQNEVIFNTLSGKLKVEKDKEMYKMEFPAYQLHEVPVTKEMEEAFGYKPIRAMMGRDLVCEFASEDIIKKMNPDSNKLMKLDGLLQHATALGEKYDIVSRTFAPKLKIKEDPVCGSGHCHLIPYWSKTLGNNITAYQASSRGGILYCKLIGDKVYLSGNAVLYAISEVMVDTST